MIAMAYSWSQRGISYFLSKCGLTVPAQKMPKKCTCLALKMTTATVGSKEISRLEQTHLLYTNLQLIDEQTNRRHFF